MQSTGLMFFLALGSSRLERRLLKPKSISLRFFGLMKLIWFDRALRWAQPWESQ
jgi:hypothetical protein